MTSFSEGMPSRFWVDVNAAENERIALFTAVATLLDGNMVGVILAHKTNLHQPFAAGDLGVNDLAGFLAIGCQRLFA